MVSVSPRGDRMLAPKTTLPQVLRVDLRDGRKQASSRDLYMQIDVNGMVQQTKVIDAASDSWNEAFPM